MAAQCLQSRCSKAALLPLWALLLVMQAMTHSVESPNLDMIERVAKQNLEAQKIHQP